MARSTPNLVPSPPPLWGWSESARTWCLVLGALAALWLIVIGGPGETAGPPLVPPRLIVDPNRAPPEVLDVLPKLGPRLVARIVAARNEAPFRSIEDLDARIDGIGPVTMKALRPHLHIESVPDDATANDFEWAPAPASGGRRGLVKLSY